MKLPLSIITSVVGSGLLLGCGLPADSEADVLLAWRIVERIELQAPDSAMTPNPLAGVVADPARGLIYVLDDPQHRVLVFDSLGTFVRQVGAVGSGPGELRSPVAIALREDGSLSVLDYSLGRLARWSADGEWLGAEPFSVSYWGHGLADQVDRVILVADGQSTDPLEIRQDLVEVADGSTVTIASVPIRQTMVELPCMQQPVPIPKLFAPTVVWTAVGDTTIVLDGPDYKLDLHHAGQVVGSLTRQLPPVRVTAGMATDLLRAGQYDFLTDRCGMDTLSVVRSLGYEETVAAVRSLTSGPDGRLWVARSAGEGETFLVDLFEPDGRYLGTLASSLTPAAFVTSSKFVGYETGGDHVMTLKIAEIIDDSD